MEFGMNTLKVITSFCFAIIFSASTSAQEKIQILVLGTSHYNEKKDSLEYKEVIDKLTDFNPDMVMGEFVSPQEYVSLEPNSYRRKVNDSTAARLVEFPNLHRSRIDLAVQLLNSYDLGNAKYQIYVLEKLKKVHFNKEEAAAYKTMLGGTEKLVQHNLYQNTSEYNAIIFPLMYRLNISGIYPADCQVYDTKWTQAWRIVAYCMHFINRIAEMDDTSEEAKIVKKIRDEKNRIYSESDSLGLYGYRYLNSSFNAEESDLVNFYGGEKLFDFSKNYPEKEVREMIKYWQLRNEGMAANILKQAREKKAKRVLVAAGSAHQKWIADILKEQPDVVVIGYNDL